MATMWTPGALDEAPDENRMTRDEAAEALLAAAEAPPPDAEPAAPTDEAAPEAASVVSDAPAEADSEAGKAPPSDEKPAEVVAATPEAPAAPAGEPVTFTANGAPFEIPGALRDPATGAVTLPKEQWTTAQQVLARGMANEAWFRDVQRREAAAKTAEVAAKTAGAEQEAYAGALAEGLAALLQNDADLAAYLGPKVQELMLRADNAKLAKRAELYETRTRPSPEDVEKQAGQKMQDILSSEARRAYPMLFADPETAQRIISKYAADAGRYITDPSKPDGVNWSALDRALKADADLVQTLTAKQQAAAKAATTQQTATRANAPAQKPSPATAPSVTQAARTLAQAKGRRVATPDPEDEEAAFQASKRSMRAAILSDDD